MIVEDGSVFSTEEIFIGSGCWCSVYAHSLKNQDEFNLELQLLTYVSDAEGRESGQDVAELLDNFLCSS